MNERHLSLFEADDPRRRLHRVNVNARIMQDNLIAIHNAGVEAKKQAKRARKAQRKDRK